MPQVNCCMNCAKLHYYDRYMKKNENKCGVDDTFIDPTAQSTTCCRMFSLRNQDSYLEVKWHEFADVSFDDTGSDTDLVLAEDWWLFEKGTDREEIWKYFDKLYSKGICALLYESN